MRKYLPLLVLSCFLSCKKEEIKPAEPWYRINLRAMVKNEGVLYAGSYYWKSSVSFDKEVYDSVFVVVQWDAYSLPGNYLRTIKDTVLLLPQKSNTVDHLSNSLYQYPWTAQEVKIVYAWSSYWGRYDLRY